MARPPVRRGPQWTRWRPKFYDDVLPIFVENCIGCHEEGGIGTFGLEDYERAKGLAELIAISTSERTMPPFTANNGGDCHTFQDARWLTEEQIETIAAWVDGGTPEGNPAAPQPPRPELEVLQGSDIRDVHHALRTIFPRPMRPDLWMTTSASSWSRAAARAAT